MSQVLSAPSSHFETARAVQPHQSPLSTELQPEDIRATIRYQAPNEDELFYIRDPEPGQKETNFAPDDQEVLVTDIRGSSKRDYNLDSTGFQLVNDTKYDPDYELFSDPERIGSEYYAQIEDIIKENTGASRVVIFDHTIRRRQENTPDTVGNRQPVLAAHVDQTTKAAIARVHRHLGDEADELLKNSRVQLINVWRPLFNDVTDNPLAFADYRSIDPEKDLAVSKLIYPDYVGETFRVKYNPTHRWYYYSHQNKNDVFLIKCYDSNEDVARCTPHTAFVNPKSPAWARPRESIEVRALVFHENK